MQLHHHNHPTESGHSDSSKHTGGWLLAILLVAQLMVILDITAVNIAMPNIAKDLGISESCLRNWMAQAGADDGGRQDRLTTAEKKELTELRRRNRQLEMENEILKRAAAYFAKENVLPK